MFQLSVIASFFILCSTASAQSYAFGADAFAAAPGPTVIVAGDFNRDGRTDLAVADQNGISVLLGKPNGTFEPKVDYSVDGLTPTALAIGDVNSDGKVDLIATSTFAPHATVWILLGNGNGTFQPSVSVPLPNVNGAAGVATSDFNKDGKLDLAIAASGFGGSVVSILLGKGDGTFEPEVDYPTAQDTVVITADFNGDGNPDLALGGASEPISILLGKGDGTFEPYRSVPLPANGGGSLAAADLNHDGNIDLVTVAESDAAVGGVSVLLGNGDGTFAAAASYPTGTGTYTNAVAIADFNGDGKPDIAATNLDGYDLSVFIGVGDGTFKKALTYPASIRPVGLVVGDFNGDGHQDIASIAGYLLSSAVTVLIGRGDGTFTNHVNHTVPVYPYDIEAGDFNGDGKPDLVINSFDKPGALSILLGDEDGTFKNHIDTQVGDYPAYLAIGDFNADGKLDVVVNVADPITGAEMLSTLLGNGDGTLRPPLNQPLSSVPGKWAVADFNLDGKLDLAACLQNTKGASIFLGKGDGTFAPPSFFNAGDLCGDPNPVFSADLNGDHKPDIILSTYSGISILLGDGNGSFQPYHAILPGYSLLGVGDFNGDGKPDIVVASSSTPFIGIAIGNGDGTFKSPKTIYFPTSADRWFVGDFNGDGKLDFAFISSSYMTLSVLPGNGNGTFGTRIDLPTENSPWSITASDFTGRGGLDIAVGVAGLATTHGSVSIYGGRPVGSLYPSSLHFGSQTVGSSSKALMTKLQNSGGAPLPISAITTSGEYGQTNDCGKSLAVGSSCTISVTFRPSKAGNQDGSLNIQDGATTTPQIISLTGLGVR